ncbi:hypothetical protein V6N13_014193 [Hibiscus sabdariffa]|uniref:NB-ARC domain-containing protein n=1 Tax=Hibiscus sabdariffa TaxID=183260 RepID=A0ABR2RV16_9ROSI
MYLQASATLQYLLEYITKTIKQITFFLVLDDVWSINDNEGWEQLQAVLKQSKAGSRILVTTRKVFVAKSMSDSDLIYHLSDWPELDCWSMLDQFAFDGKDRLSDEERESLRKISMKSKGLPLVAKALGNFLQKQPLEWGSLQHKELWQIEDVWKLVMPSLLLSYLDLPLNIRQCFLYCAIFPKGLLIRTDNLINHWMAQEYSTCGTDVDMEDTGRGFFSHLASCCLFQYFEKEGDADIVACKMHDMIHDLAQYLTRKDFVTIELTTLG